MKLLYVLKNQQLWEQNLVHFLAPQKIIIKKKELRWPCLVLGCLSCRQGMQYKTEVMLWHRDEYGGFSWAGWGRHCLLGIVAAPWLQSARKEKKRKSSDSALGKDLLSLSFPFSVQGLRLGGWAGKIVRFSPRRIKTGGLQVYAWLWTSSTWRSPLASIGYVLRLEEQQKWEKAKKLLSLASAEFFPSVMACWNFIFFAQPRWGKHDRALVGGKKKVKEYENRGCRKKYQKGRQGEMKPVCLGWR